MPAATDDASPIAPAAAKPGRTGFNFARRACGPGGARPADWLRSCRGFDAEAHARALRLQIEALVAVPTAAAAATATAPTRILQAGKPTPPRTAAVAPMWTEPAKLAGDSAIRMAIEKMRAAIDELEAQLKGK